MLKERRGSREEEERIRKRRSKRKWREREGR